MIGICENTPRISIIGSLSSVDPSARATSGCGLMQVRNFGAVNSNITGTITLVKIAMIG